VRTYRLTDNEITLSERDDPKPGPTEILIRVHAASINRRDIMLLEGTYPLPARPGVVPLSDGAGEVVAVGADVSRFTVGDRVTGSYWPRWRAGRLTADVIDQLGCTVDGMATEFAVLDEQWAVRVPDHLSWAEAACLSCAGVTAWCSVVGSEAAAPGRTVLTLGTGDVSLFALRFAKLLGCKVIVTTSHDAKAARLTALGADHVINYRTTPRWGDAVRDLTGGADLVVETVGPETIAQSITAAGLYGEVVLLIWKSAGRPDLVIPGDVYGPKLATIRRLFVGSRTDLENLTTAMAAHKVRPVIDRVFPFDALPEAYQRFRSPQRFGKVVIETL
jgi:NADPH:quinone reductase-like Zn-dependent oxidoreductase